MVMQMISGEEEVAIVLLVYFVPVNSQWHQWAFSSRSHVTSLKFLQSVDGCLTCKVLESVLYLRTVAGALKLQQIMLPFQFVQWTHLDARNKYQRNFEGPSKPPLERKRCIVFYRISGARSSCDPKSYGTSMDCSGNAGKSGKRV